MRHSVTGAFLALTFAMGITACAPVPVQGQAVAVGPTVAFSYSDGYWDRNRQWHGWRDRDEAERYRRQNPQYHVDRRHDEVNGWGWRDDNRYWERR